MKRILAFLFLSIFISNSLSMERKRKTEQLTPEEASAFKKPRGGEIISTKSEFEKLPAQLKDIIFRHLLTAPGKTNAAKLQAAAENIRNFMTLSQTFKPYLDDEEINGYIITELATRYTDGNLVIAMIALRTRAGARWLNAQINKKISDQLFLALVEAARNNEVNIASFLLNNIPHMAQNVDRFIGSLNPLSIASQNGNIAIVEQLLQVPGINVNLQEPLNHQTALMQAAHNGHTATVERLLQAPGINTNLQTKQGATALMFATQQGHVAVIEQLLKAPTLNVNLQNREGVSALMAAAQDGHAKIVEQLLKVPGINMNAQSIKGNNALIVASHHGHIAIVEQLLQAGANPNLLIIGKTILRWARQSNWPEKDKIIKLLIEHGAKE